jgi:hypothetical protein
MRKSPCLSRGRLIFGGELAVLEAPIFDRLSLYPVALGQDSGTTAEVDVSAGVRLSTLS